MIEEHVLHDQSREQGTLPETKAVSGSTRKHVRQMAALVEHCREARVSASAKATRLCFHISLRAAFVPSHVIWSRPCGQHLTPLSTWKGGDRLPDVDESEASCETATFAVYFFWFSCICLFILLFPFL